MHFIDNVYNQAKIKKWLKKMKIKNYTINPDLTVDVKGDVNISHSHLDFIPIQFGVVSESFYCYNNRLKTLKGTPHEVGEDFYCHNNVLLNLEDGPKKVGRTYHFSDNQVVSLKGMPNEITDLIAGNNDITSLEYLPKTIKRHCNVNDNPIEKIGSATCHTENMNLTNNKLAQLTYLDIINIKAQTLVVSNDLISSFMVSIKPSIIEQSPLTTTLDFNQLKEILYLDYEKTYLEKNVEINAKTVKKLKI